MRVSLSVTNGGSTHSSVGRRVVQPGGVGRLQRGSNISLKRFIRTCLTPASLGSQEPHFDRRGNKACCFFCCCCCITPETYGAVMAAMPHSGWRYYLVAPYGGSSVCPSLCTHSKPMNECFGNARYRRPWGLQRSPPCLSLFRSLALTLSLSLSLSLSLCLARSLSHCHTPSPTPINNCRVQAANQKHIRSFLCTDAVIYYGWEAANCMHGNR